MIVVEIDENFTIGIDNYKKVKGLRLGYLAIHLVFSNIEEFANSLRNKNEPN